MSNTELMTIDSSSLVTATGGVDLGNIARDSGIGGPRESLRPTIKDATIDEGKPYRERGHLLRGLGGLPTPAQSMSR